MEPTDIPKAYDPKEWEDRLYRKWEESGFFNPDTCIKKGVTKADAEPFSILMPPPNVTGVLHLGHAMENSIMDVVARYHRMRGERTLFLPGADHAAVATQSRVEKNLVASGMSNPRQELGRERLLEKIRAFADESKDTITKQVRAMGSSCDWSRFAYTFDDARVLAVNTMFKKMYDDGLIYKGYRVVNWSVKGQSTCSDDELEHIERPATLYTFRYSKDFPIPVATTRPETKLGDTAVAVHPEDPRYRDLIGQIFEVEIGAAKPLSIRIIGDEEVDPSFGTGAVGVTPAHSQTDFDIRQRHPEISLVQVIGTDGKMTADAGPTYAGLTALEAREKFIAAIREKGLLEKEEDITQNVGTSDRFGDVIEVVPMEQWFVAVNKEIPGRGKTLKDLMREAVTTGLGGDPEKRTSVQPEQFEKIYLHWIDSLRDWCISRQIWWGHRIPVWYREKSKVESEKSEVSEGEGEAEIYCGMEAPEGEGWEQDPDTLDTWFSSGLWTFSTLGWPDTEADDFKTFHPVTFMQMGSEIVFFWMARMILMTTYTLDTIPFKTVYIHGILRDKDGRKFSKSLGNGIDPIDIGKEYGTDALRLALLSDVTPGNDSRFSTEKMETSRNFVNKLWNISRYIATMSVASDEAPAPKSLSDRFILGRLSQIIHETTGHLSENRFSLASETLRSFTLDDFADWYVEIHKVEKNDTVLRHVFDALLRLWHPFLPFVTEAINETRGDDTSLMIAKWPEFEKTQNISSDENRFKLIKDLIVKIRNIRTVYKIDPKQKLVITAYGGSEKALQDKALDESGVIRDNEEVFKKLARISEVRHTDSRIPPKGTVRIQVGLLYIFLHLDGIIDIDAERARLGKELADAETYAKSLEAKLGNPSFAERAPEAIVTQTRNLLDETNTKVEELSGHLFSISS
ncbi:MAG TPA: valine--tRNA ligase [Candidatus Fimivivens sp.]|nr:valine--tRNA ligase [Candidatus Fimivivens sp.]